MSSSLPTAEQLRQPAVPGTAAAPAAPAPIITRAVRATRSFFYSQLPKRKMVVRAALCGAIATMPMMFAVMIQRWYVMLPFLAVIGALIYYSGIGEDVSKQLRWMRRMSERGPVFKLARFLRRQYVRAKRRYYGDALDVLPLAPTVVGTSVRTTNAAMLKWLVKPHSEFSVERYEVQLRPKESGESEWEQLAPALDEPKHAAGPLTPDTEYEVRVRAHNSKGQSEWCAASFRTKQEPKEGGGAGPGYAWTQGGAKNDEVAVRVALPAGTRARQMGVTVKPTTLSITLLQSDGQRATLVAGDLFAPVKADDIEWELVEAEGGAKELKLNLLKQNAQGPFWPCLVRGHPEVETSGMKKAEMSTEQLMEELGALGRAPGMMGGMGAGGMEAMMNAMGGGSGDMEGFSG